MKYIILVLFVIIAYSCAYDADTSSENTQLTPKQLLLELNDDRRFISTDVIADKLINKDPSVLLVDVRPIEEYGKFSLPGAKNVPLSKILDADSRDLLNCQKYDLVFFSNSTVLSDQAWILNRKEGCYNSYVMEGGLDAWVETIMNPTKPEETADQSEFERYQLRRAACKYFIGASTELKPEPYVAAKPKKAVNVTPKKKVVKKVVEEEEEGC